MAAVIVEPRYVAITRTTVTLFDAMARPAPMIEDPTYSGCANQRYGPDEVTSRDLLRCPAAQIRSPSPTAARAAPTPSVGPVGSASHSTSAAEANPSGTRLRASPSASRARRQIGRAHV